jgi:pimeloyl-ACP methyl ester carboxylesterase
MRLAFRILMVVVIAVAVFLVAGLIAVWAPDRPVERLTPRWATPPSQFVQVGATRVHLRDEGPRSDPAPIVLLHGTSASLHTWEGWAEALRGQRRVIRFDLAGFGLTGPNSQNNYSIETYVSFVTAVLDKLGVQRFVLVGNSLGGQIALATAHALPQRVDKLVLVDSAGYAFTPESIPLGFRIARVPGLRGLVEVVLPRGVVQDSVRNVYGDPTKVTPELVDRYYELTLRAGNRRALAKRFQQMLVSNSEHIKSLKLPTLILWGGKDRLIPPDNGRQFARDILGARLVVFDDLGHVPQEEDPERTVAELKRFLGMTGPDT